MNSKTLEKLGITREDAITSFLFYGGTFSAGFMASLIGIVLPILQKEYGIDYKVSGAILSVHQIGSFLACLIAGLLPSWIGLKKTALIMYSTIWIGLMMLVSSPAPFLIGLSFFMMGIGRGAQGNIGSVVSGINFGNSTAGLNLLHSTFALGALISPFFALLFPGNLWRIPLVVNAVMMFLFVFGLCFRHQEEPKDTRKNKNERSTVRWWVDPGYWLNIIIIFFYQCVEYSLNSWMVTYFVNENILSSGIASAMPSILWAAILISRLFCVFASSRFSKNRMIMTMVIMISSSYAFLMATRNPVAIVALLFIVGLGMGGLYPTTFSTMKREFLESSKAMGIGIAITSFGAILMPSVIGFVSSSYGMTAGMSTILVAMAMLVLSVVMKCIRDKRERA